ncbi:hypothetical protein Drose_12495 [Dactylosporangium roseum]|uniref:Uncharacterized protein n=1 Tax=Dactylosporangium roseum TaxID=47989 RepID=A0ABY5ZA42_9ACTN|nr:hypothetical protein [Dactylosporangium roseum]UWZ38965.1 hypothetical protein Drose_12495 [Dactylosporangium roseum]
MTTQPTPAPRRSRSRPRAHEQVEHLAVSEFDWIGAPITAVVDAVCRLARHVVHPGRRGRRSREYRLPVWW